MPVCRGMNSPTSPPTAEPPSRGTRPSRRCASAGVETQRTKAPTSASERMLVCVICLHSVEGSTGNLDAWESPSAAGGRESQMISTSRLSWVSGYGALVWLCLVGTWRPMIGRRLHFLPDHLSSAVANAELARESELTDDDDRFGESASAVADREGVSTGNKRPRCRTIGI